MSEYKGVLLYEVYNCKKALAKIPDAPLSEPFLQGD